MGQRTPRRPDESPSPSAIQLELAELRVRYRRELPQKIRAVKDAAGALGADAPREGLEALHILVHRLVGSAAIYGFDAVSRAAALLEDLVVEGLAGAAPTRAWTERLHALVAGLEQAAAAPVP
jgi:HPt (histidine-containing phosphotransfer) domain-containing protein